MLKHGLKNSDLTNTDFFQLNFSDITRKLGKRCCRAGLGSVLDPLIRLLRKGVLKQELSDIQVTTIFGGNNFGNN